MADSMPTTAVLHTSMGPIRLELFPNHAPKTVRNFVELAEGKRQGATDPRNGQPISGPYYDGVTFHRVMADFMIQTGDPTGTGRGGPGYTFADEIHPELTFDRPYLLAMANAGPGPNNQGTNGSQFFITVVPTTWLNFKHTIFGAVADQESADVVLAISQVDTASERPREPVTIQRVEFER
ncbi:MAG TPA: peptidylprolyl isomerase [Candidatus Limnocylindrales bacterium]